MTGESRLAADISVDECFSDGRSPRLAREPLDRPLLPDLTEAASLDSVLGKAVEARGLSTLLLLPGIFDRKERKDLDDCWVSDLLKEGYDCKSPELLFRPEPPSLELWLPIAKQECLVAHEGATGVSKCTWRRRIDSECLSNEVSNAASAEHVVAIIVFEICCAVDDSMRRMFMEGGGVGRRDQRKGSDGTVRRPFCVSLTRALSQVTSRQLFDRRNRWKRLSRQCLASGATW